MALSVLLWPRTALAALPPASIGTSAPSREAANPAPEPQPVAPAAPGSGELSWWDSPWIVAPRIGLYGYAGYEWSRYTFENEESLSRGMVAMIGGRFQSYIWQPWFGQFSSDLRARMGRDNSELQRREEERTMSSKNLSLTGNAKLNLFHRSRFPFEAHFDRDYSRTAAGDQPAFGSYINQRFGFMQTYKGLDGLDGTMGWEHSAQTAREAGKTTQDHLQLTLSYKLSDESSVGMSGSRSMASHKGSGQRTVQNNLSMSHNYLPTPEISVDTTANISTSAFQMNPGGNENRLLQVNTVGFWRPEEEPLTITASARVLGLAAENTVFDFVNGTFVPIRAEARMNTGNMALGASYIFSPETSANATINAGFMTVNGERHMVYSESAGISYSPEEIQLGEFVYRWNTGAGVSHQGGSAGGGAGAGASLALQLSQSLNRRMQVGEDSTISFTASQGLGYTTKTQVLADMPRASAQVTHSASVSWNTGARKGGGATVMVGASDSRSLEGDKHFFQMVNLNLSGNISFGANSSLSGSLGVQATRQSALRLPTLSPNGSGPGADDIVTTSNGSISYRNLRLFGVRRLVLTTDLRMTSQALLPMLGGPLDQELAAWDTRIEYMLGMTTLRVNTLVSRTTIPYFRTTFNGADLAEPETRMNRSIMFSVTRAFGS